MKHLRSAQTKRIIAIVISALCTAVCFYRFNAMTALGWYLMLAVDIVGIIVVLVATVRIHAIKSYLRQPVDTAR